MKPSFFIQRDFRKFRKYMIVAFKLRYNEGGGKIFIVAQSQHEKGEKKSECFE